MPTDENVKYEYRFNSRRYGEESRLYDRKTFEGRSRDECDRLAAEHGKQLAAQPTMRSEIITVVRIDTLAVAEQTTPIWRNRQEPNPDTDSSL